MYKYFDSETGKVKESPTPLCATITINKKQPMSKDYKEKQLVGLKQYIQTEVTIQCTKCGDGTMFYNVIDAYQEAYAEGWRVTEKHCYCPNCAPVYLKKLHPSKKKK